ncbi:hypothetical protein ACSBL2_07000 [Pedobacter sp. AW31-3R]
MENLYFTGASFSPFSNWFCFVFDCSFERTEEYKVLMGIDF